MKRVAFVLALVVGLFFILRAVPGPIGTPTALSPGFNPGAGATVINPIIDCNYDAVNNTTGPTGIIVDQSNTTIINPSIRECVTGIVVRKLSGVAPTNVRIIADAAYVGYAQTNLTLNRISIAWDAGNGEIGDISVPDAQVGGEFSFVQNYRYFQGVTSTSLRVHHTTAGCGGTCISWSNSRKPGAHWGFKFLADRTLGAPYQATNVRFDHNVVGGYHDEGIGFDSRANDPQRANLAGATVSSVDPLANTISVTGYFPAVPAESLDSQWVTFNDGAAQAATLQIISGLHTLTLADPANVLAQVSPGDRISVGMRFTRNLIDHNRVEQTGAKSGIDFHGMQTFSRIEGNVIHGVADLVYAPRFHTRSAVAPQCIMVKSMAGPAAPAFSFLNSVVRNTCDSGGDISLTVISWGTYEVNSSNWASGNVFTGTPSGQLHRYEAPQPASDPTV